MNNLTCLEKWALLNHGHGKRRAHDGGFGGRSGLVAVGLTVALCISVSDAAAQTTTPPAGDESPVQLQLMQPPGPGQSAPPITVTLQDALERARKNDAQFLAAVGDAKIVHEDRVQARNALLPTISYTTQYLGTQGNGATPNGRYATNDGIHVYRAWGVFHQDLSPNTYMGTGYRRASAAEAIANAKAEIARRGLTVTVTKLYYALAVSQRKYATAQQALEQGKHFLDISQNLERAGQAAHSDAVKAEIQYGQQLQAFQEAKLAMENARLDLAVLLFPTLHENFSVVDDLDSAAALPPFAEVRGMAERENPTLRVAIEAMRQADLDVTAAKGAFFPSFFVDTDYGIEANAFALHSRLAADTQARVLPNLGYFITAGVNVPVWDWGSLRSKFHQAQYKREQARVELSQTQRETLSNLFSFYNEASVARAAVEGSRHTADLAAESLRLINLRYQGGLSTALEVVDAENTLTLARNAYDDAQARYRVARANLQTLTGTF